MKRTIKMIKTGLVVLFFFTIGVINAQNTEGTITKGPLKLGPHSDHTAANRATALGASLTPDYEQKNVVLFYKPNASATASETGATLVASRTEDFTGITPEVTRAPQNFTHYRWSYMGKANAGIESGINFNSNLSATDGYLKKYESANDNKLVLTGLTQGYHYFKVQGYIIPEEASLDNACPPQHEETFVVYVLPQLSITASRNDQGSGALQYCESNASSQGSVVLKAEAKYSSYSGLPTDLAGFELKYTWYAVKANNDGTYPLIAIDKSSTTGIHGQGVSNTETSNSNTFTPTIADIGKYKYFVEVEYTAKERDYDGTENLSNRKRTYALYRGWVGGNDQNSATEVFVTPAPGKPHITIESVND